MSPLSPTPPPRPPWKGATPEEAFEEAELRRADLEKAKRRTSGGIPPANLIRRPMVEPPMERIQEP